MLTILVKSFSSVLTGLVTFPEASFATGADGFSTVAFVSFGTDLPDNSRGKFYFKKGYN